MKFYRWGKPKDDDGPVPITPPPELEQKYDMLIVTDTETYRVNDIPKSKCCSWAQTWGRYGAMLEQGGEPMLFIPARRIMEIKFEKVNDANTNM